MGIGTALAAASQDLQALRAHDQRQAFSRLAGGAGSIDLGQWRQALQQLPGAANNAGVTGTGTASAIDAAFQSLDGNKDGQVSQAEFGAALDRMLDRARGRHRQGGLDSLLQAQMAPPSGGVQAPDFLRRVLLGYSANA